MILIITNKEDSHPTPVINILHSINIPVFRLNTESLLTDYEFRWYYNLDGIDFGIKNTQNGLKVKGSQVTAVWDRRPETPSELLVHSTSEIDKHNINEASGFLTFLRYYIKDIFSIGSIVFDRVAASKMLQIKLAKEIGFSLPFTCFSNRKNDIIKFASEFENVLLKSIENDSVWDENEGLEYVFYAKKVKSAELFNLPDEAFSQTVSFVQNYIEKKFELRITIVRDKIFASKIESQGLDEDNGKIDWRQGYEHGIKFEPFNLPEDISNKCLMYLRKMGLNFGCFDFIVTPADDYVFLECNPNGQWLWIELETGMKISQAIAEELMQKR